MLLSYLRPQGWVRSVLMWLLCVLAGCCSSVAVWTCSSSNACLMLDPSHTSSLGTMARDRNQVRQAVDKQWSFCASWMCAGWLCVGTLLEIMSTRACRNSCGYPQHHHLSHYLGGVQHSMSRCHVTACCVMSHCDAYVPLWLLLQAGA